MSLVGQLADLRLDDILKIIHLSRKSGQLTVSDRDQVWNIAFWHGEVVRLSSLHLVPHLAAELEARDVLEKDLLERASELFSSDPAGDLRRVLVGCFSLAPQLVNDVFQPLARRLLQQLASWTEGQFCFDLWEDVDRLPATEAVPHLLLGDRLESAPSSPMSASDTRQNDPPAVATGASARDIETSGMPREEFPNPVWIVDDDPCLRQELGSYLDAHGLHVEQFETAADFWIQLKKARLEGIVPAALIDLVMPCLNGEGMLGGLELLEKVVCTYPDMRVLPLSDHRSSEAEDKAWQLGLPEIFSKPLQPDMLRDQWRRAVETLGRSLFLSLRAVAGSPVPENISPSVATSDRERQGSGNGVQRGFRNSPGLHLLKGMLEELNNPCLGGGIILLVLRFASEVMNRAVIFSVKQDQIVGIGQFGVALAGGDTNHAIRNIVIPRDSDSILSRMLCSPQSMRARFGDGRWDRFLAQALGGGIPEDIFLGPVFSEGRVVAILYGDNLPEHRPVGNTEALEIFLSQAGLAMEKALLEERLQVSRTGLQGA